MRDGNYANEGRVEIYNNGAWGTVCHDSWDIQDANVVCISIGFPRAAAALGGAAFGQGTGAVLLDDVNCTGTESAIFDCPHGGLRIHNCDHSHDAGVRCEHSGKMRQILKEMYHQFMGLLQYLLSISNQNSS